MNARVSKLSKTLLDLSQVADTVLRVGQSGAAALRGKSLSMAERCLLERIDGFRSVEQVLAISGDVVGVHAALGKLIALGMVVPEGEADRAPAAATPPTDAPRTDAPRAAPANNAPPAPTPALPHHQRSVNIKPVVQKAAAPFASARTAAASPPSKPAPAPAVAKAGIPANPVASDELSRAKALLRTEAGYLFGTKASQVVARIDACRSIEQIYDLIVKLQGHLAKGGKVDPGVFLERLSAGLAKIRQSQGTPRRANA
ncbi:MAG: hypothetical protein JNK75_01865 [Betaproteobacteria bacterium]|nr:hypothetical protein [Betaproteobacteria bacterium]